MEFKFNSLDLIRPPRIAICRLDLEMIGYLDAYGIVIKPTFCNVSELSFTCDSTTQFYNCLRKDMVLDVEGFGRFVITDVEEEDNGQTKVMNVSAQSYEVTMNRVTISYTDNTVFKLWDPIDPAHGSQVIQPDGQRMDLPTLLYIIQQQTGWTIKYVDPEESVWNQYRTMSIDKEQVYGLLMGTVADSYNVYFEFDSANKWIYCYGKDRTPTNTGINLSFRNVIREQKISSASDEVITALTVKGAEGVGISLVNPLGNDTLYDFSYYMNDEEWGMSSDLQDAVTAWEANIESQRTLYEREVSRRREKDVEVQELKSDLKILQSELLALEDVQAVDIAAGNDEGLALIYPQIIAKEGAIKNTQMDLDVAEAEYRSIVAAISTIVTSLSFENNFTTAQLEALQYYVNGSVYENANFVFTTDMPESRKIEMEQQLYAYGLSQFKKMSSPEYEYTCTIEPFMFSKEYEEFSKNIKLGGAANLELESGEWVEPRILQVVIDYDNPSNTTMTLSDSFRLADSVHIFSDGFNQAIKASRKTSTAAPLWDEPVNNGFYGTVTEYINNALNLANQEIINADNQEFKLGSYGLRGKMWDEVQGDYDPHQVAMTNNVLAFTDDNWQSCKMAIGKVTIGQSEYYGVVAEAIVGELIAGSQLTIRDADSSFVVDGSGVNLENAPFTVYNSQSRILINPTDGFKIQKKNGNVWDTVLSEDNSGNIVANSITLQTGYIGGWEIKSDGLYSPAGDRIKSDGTGKISLLTYTNNAAYFDGNIYANNLQWNAGQGQVVNVWGSDGFLSGSWLGAGSVGTAKRNSTEWDALYANKIYCDQLFATMITADNLKAGYIDAQGVVTDLLFGGQYFVGVSSNPYNRATLYGQREDISSQIQDQYSMYVKTAGHIHLEPDNGGVLIGGTGYLSASQVTTTNATVNGTLATDWLQVTNKINRCIVSDAFAVGEDGGQNNPTGTFYGDLVVKGRIWLNGSVACDNGNEVGATADVTVDGRILHFKKGIFLGTW